MRIRFEINAMYKNIYKDVNMAFMVNDVIEKNKNGVVLNVDWYQKTEYNKYISIGINQDFAIPKDTQLYYVKI